MDLYIVNTLLKIITEKLLFNQLIFFPIILLLLVKLLKHPKTDVTLWKFFAFYLYKISFS